MLGIIGEESPTLTGHNLASREENTPRNATKLSGFNHLGFFLNTSAVDVVASVVDTISGDVVVSFSIVALVLGISWFNLIKMH